jgi:hypothetical protein
VQLTELHQCKAELEMEQATIIDLMKASARARAIAVAINREVLPRPTFARASHNMAAAAALLDTLPMPSTDGVDRVYHQLRDILDIATEQYAES